MSWGLLRHLRLAIVLVLLLGALGGVPGPGARVPKAVAQTPSASPEPVSPEPAAPTKPTEPRNVEVVGQVSGGVSVAVIEGGYAYLGQGRRLVILDLADPTR